MRVTASTPALQRPMAPAPTPSSKLARGATGPSVEALQRALARAGFDPGTVDGRFGPNTERAVRAFQRAHGLTEDGVVGRFTQAALTGTSVPPSQTPPASGGTGEVSGNRARTDTIGGVSTWKVSGKNGVAFKSGMSVDADGSPRAYHPNNTGLDALGNAGRPGNWWALATKNGQPVVQGPNDPAPGYYVSTTALTDSRFAATDPRRYVNSETVPFIAVPPQLVKEQGVKLGDLVAVRNDRTGKTVFAVVADIGPKDHLGEGSIKLAQELGINPDARRGGTGSGVSYVVFPGSRPAGALTHERIQAEGRRAFEAWGGDAQLASAVR